MPTKLEQIDRSGSLDEFARSVWDAQVQGFCEVQEAIDAIAEYARELAQAASAPASAIEHNCEVPVLGRDNTRLIIPPSVMFKGECNAGCCVFFACVVCGKTLHVRWPERRELWKRLYEEQE